MKTKSNIEKIIELLKTNNMTQRQLCDVLYGPDKDAPIIYPYLRQLMDSGVISRTDERPVRYFLTGTKIDFVPRVKKETYVKKIVEDTKAPDDFKPIDLSNKEFNPQMVQQVLNAIALKNHFFVSEVHFQTEFIIAAAKLFPTFEYFPEIVPSKTPNQFLEFYGEKGVHFDLVIKGVNENVLIEFKYLTDAYFETVNGFDLRVKKQSAYDIRRYDCWKDISRIELFVNDDNNIDYGYFLLITNEPALWRTSNSATLDKDFHMNNGYHAAGSKKWQNDIDSGAARNRENPIHIRNSYLFEYKTFYDSKKKRGLFKSLIVPID